MPSCKTCGAYTPYPGGQCRTCYYGGKSKAGKVYGAEVTFPSGKKTIYTGQTSRSVRERIGEHMKYQNNGDTGHYTGRGVSIRPIGSIFSNNRFKAEKTVKGMTREEKERLFRNGARQYKKRR